MSGRQPAQRILPGCKRWSLSRVIQGSSSLKRSRFGCVNPHNPFHNSTRRGPVAQADGPLNERRGQHEPVVRQTFRNDLRGFEVREHRKDQATDRLDQFCKRETAHTAVILFKMAKEFNEIEIFVCVDELVGP